MKGIKTQRANETLLERIERSAPETFSWFDPKLSNPQPFLAPHELFTEIVEKRNRRRKQRGDPGALTKKMLGTHAGRGTYALLIDELVMQYAGEFMRGQRDEDNVVKDQFFKKLADDFPVFEAKYDLVHGTAKGVSTLHRLEVILNRKKYRGLQKMETYASLQDIINKNRKAYLMATEISRRESSKDKGHFFVEYVYNKSDATGYHLVLLPNVTRRNVNKMQSHWLREVDNRGYESLPSFRWVLDKAEEFTDISAWDEVSKIQDNTDLINRIMKSPETKEQFGSFQKKLRELEHMFIPTRIAEDLGKKYKQHGPILIDDPDLDKRSKGELKRLNVTAIRDGLHERYNGQIGMKQNTDLDMRIVDDIIKLDDDHEYSEMYYHVPSPGPNGKERTYAIYQLYTHRPSSTYEGDKFESFLEVANLDPIEQDNRFVLKIEEIGKDIYMVEQMTWGKVLEHHVEIVKGNKENIIDLPRRIREHLHSEENRYTTAPLWVNFMQEFR